MSVVSANGVLSPLRDMKEEHLLDLALLLEKLEANEHFIHCLEMLPNPIIATVFSDGYSKITIGIDPAITTLEVTTEVFKDLVSEAIVMREIGVTNSLHKDEDTSTHYKETYRS